MMINVALHSSEFQNDQIKVLDPIAGKGTTLYESLVCGYDAYGVEIYAKSVTEAYRYMTQYLEKERYKHSTGTQTIHGDKGAKAKKYYIDFAKTKQDMKQKKTKHWEMVEGNAMYADTYFKKNSFDIIVGDLPYGVQHGNVGNHKSSSSNTRNPIELISTCVDAWYRVLKPGGVITLAWNKFVLPRQEFANVLTDAGFVVFDKGDYLAFEHRVDQAIKRDIIVAKK
jgi:tRNA G10  N-methylase Trm11